MCVGGWVALDKSLIAEACCKVEAGLELLIDHYKRAGITGMCC